MGAGTFKLVYLLFHMVASYDFLKERLCISPVRTV